MSAGSLNLTIFASLERHIDLPEDEDDFINGVSDEEEHEVMESADFQQESLKFPHSQSLLENNQPYRANFEETNASASGFIELKSLWRVKASEEEEIDHPPKPPPDSSQPIMGNDKNISTNNTTNIAELNLSNSLQNDSRTSGSLLRREGSLIIIDDEEDDNESDLNFLIKYTSPVRDPSNVLVTAPPTDPIESLTYSVEEGNPIDRRISSISQMETCALEPTDLSSLHSSFPPQSEYVAPVTASSNMELHRSTTAPALQKSMNSLVPSSSGRRTFEDTKIMQSSAAPKQSIQRSATVLSYLPKDRNSSSSHQSRKNESLRKGQLLTIEDDIIEEEEKNDDNNWIETKDYQRKRRKMKQLTLIPAQRR